MPVFSIELKSEGNHPNLDDQPSHPKMFCMILIWMFLNMLICHPKVDVLYHTNLDVSEHACKPSESTKTLSVFSSILQELHQGGVVIMEALLTADTNIFRKECDQQHHTQN